MNSQFTFIVLNVLLANTILAADNDNEPPLDAQLKAELRTRCWPLGEPLINPTANNSQPVRVSLSFVMANLMNIDESHET